MSLPATPVTHVVDMIVAPEDRALANELINPILDQDAAAQNFAAQLSAQGEAPATFFGGFGARLSNERWVALRNALVTTAPGVTYYARGIRKAGDPASDKLVETNSGSATLGAPWSARESLADAGLAPVVVAAPF